MSDIFIYRCVHAHKQIYFPCWSVQALTGHGKGKCWASVTWEVFLGLAGALGLILCSWHVDLEQVRASTCGVVHCSLEWCQRFGDAFTEAAVSGSSCCCFGADVMSSGLLPRVTEEDKVVCVCTS